MATQRRHSGSGSDSDSNEFIPFENEDHSLRSWDSEESEDDSDEVISKQKEDESNSHSLGPGHGDRATSGVSCTDKKSCNDDAKGISDIETAKMKDSQSHDSSVVDYDKVFASSSKRREEPSPTSLPQTLTPAYGGVVRVAPLLRSRDRFTLGENLCQTEVPHCLHRFSEKGYQTEEAEVGPAPWTLLPWASEDVDPLHGKTTQESDHRRKRNDRRNKQKRNHTSDDEDDDKIVSNCHVSNKFEANHNVARPKNSLPSNRNLRELLDQTDDDTETTFSRTHYVCNSHSYLHSGSSMSNQVATETKEPSTHTLADHPKKLKDVCVKTPDHSLSFDSPKPQVSKKIMTAEVKVEAEKVATIAQYKEPFPGLDLVQKNGMPLTLSKHMPSFSGAGDDVDKGLKHIETYSESGVSAQQGPAQYDDEDGGLENGFDTPDTAKPLQLEKVAQADPKRPGDSFVQASSTRISEETRAQAKQHGDTFMGLSADQRTAQAEVDGNHWQGHAWDTRTKGGSYKGLVQKLLTSIPGDSKDLVDELLKYIRPTEILYETIVTCPLHEQNSNENNGNATPPSRQTNPNSDRGGGQDETRARDQAEDEAREAPNHHVTARSSPSSETFSELGASVLQGSAQYDEVDGRLENGLDTPDGATPLQSEVSAQVGPKGPGDSLAQGSITRTLEGTQAQAQRNRDSFLTLSAAERSAQPGEVDRGYWQSHQRGTSIGTEATAVVPRELTQYGRLQGTGSQVTARGARAEPRVVPEHDHTLGLPQQQPPPQQQRRGQARHRQHNTALQQMPVPEVRTSPVFPRTVHLDQRGCFGRHGRGDCPGIHPGRPCPASRGIAPLPYPLVMLDNWGNIPSSASLPLLGISFRFSSVTVDDILASLLHNRPVQCQGEQAVVPAHPNQQLQIAGAGQAAAVPLHLPRPAAGTGGWPRCLICNSALFLVSTAVVLFSCHHIAVCHVCAPVVPRCPICGETVLSFMLIYIS